MRYYFHTEPTMFDCVYYSVDADTRTLAGIKLDSYLRNPIEKINVYYHGRLPRKNIEYKYIG